MGVVEIEICLTWIIWRRVQIYGYVISGWPSNHFNKPFAIKLTHLQYVILWVVVVGWQNS